MSDKSMLGRLTDELLGAPVPAGVAPAEVLQEQRDRLEAGVRLALSALAQDNPESARALLEEALQRATEAQAVPISTVSPPAGDLA